MKLTNPDGGDVDVEEFIDAASLVHEAIRDIRHALLMNRDPRDIDSDEDYEEEGTERGSHKAPASSQQSDDNTRAALRQLPEEDKKKIQEQIDVFKVLPSQRQWARTG